MPVWTEVCNAIVTSKSMATAYYGTTYPYAAGKYAADGSDCSRLFRTFAK